MTDKCTDRQTPQHIPRHSQCPQFCKDQGWLAVLHTDLLYVLQKKYKKIQLYSSLNKTTGRHKNSYVTCTLQQQKNKKTQNYNYHNGDCAYYPKTNRRLNSNKQMENSWHGIWGRHTDATVNWMLTKASQPHLRITVNTLQPAGCLHTRCGEQHIIECVIKNCARRENANPKVMGYGSKHKQHSDFQLK